MATPFKQLAYDALRLAGVTKIPDAGQAVPSADQFADCMFQAQLMIDQSQVKRPMIFTERITDYPLGTAEKYTLGPGGTLGSNRPTQIDRAKLILASTGTPVFLEVRTGDYNALADLSIQAIPGALPRFLYCDYAFPTATIYLVPQDQGGDKLELYDWSPVPTITTTSDTIALPPGYSDWFVNGLAIRMASVFASQGASVSQDVRDEFRRAERAIMNHNAHAPKLRNDAPTSRNREGSYFDYYSGLPK